MSTKKDSVFCVKDLLPQMKEEDKEKWEEKNKENDSSFKYGIDTGTPQFKK